MYAKRYDTVTMCKNIAVVTGVAALARSRPIGSDDAQSGILVINIRLALTRVSP